MNFYCSVGLLRKIYILGFPRYLIWGNIDGSNFYIDPVFMCFFIVSSVCVCDCERRRYSLCLYETIMIMLSSHVLSLNEDITFLVQYSDSNNRDTEITHNYFPNVIRDVTSAVGALLGNLVQCGRLLRFTRSKTYSMDLMTGRGEVIRETLTSLTPITSTLL